MGSQKEWQKSIIISILPDFHPYICSENIYACVCVCVLSGYSTQTSLTLGLSLRQKGREFIGFYNQTAERTGM